MRMAGTAHAVNSAHLISPIFSVDIYNGKAIFLTTASICLADSRRSNGQDCQQRYMSTLEAILLGAMLAYTPAIVILAAALWNIPELEDR
jgi:hypothetical protein